jgi:pimeloyl-ACP methyl ester carboxylesterase
LEPPGTDASPVQIFHGESGPADAPVLLLVHGFPTCSVDWFALTAGLEHRFRVCCLDFPGYGFSDKPLGWGYSISRDAALLEFYVEEVLRAESLVILAHDRGSSVALSYALSQVAQTGGSGGARVEHLVLSNGNIFLPLSNLTEFQRTVLDPARAPALLEVISPALLAAGMGTTTFSPPRSADDAEVEALQATFAHAEGTKVLHETIQYLVERAVHEREWLETLSHTELATTVVWGIEDTVSPPRVASHVWDHYLARKPGRNRLYFIPDANHYLQCDRPDALAAALLHTLDPSSPATPGPIGAERGSALLVDQSRPELPAATDVLVRP